MNNRRLGQAGPTISAMGLGCNGMSLKNPRDNSESIATIRAATDAGFNFLNTADFYGSGHNEWLIAQARQGRQDDAFVSVKCGAMFDPTGRFIGIDGRPKSIKNFASYTLQRLGVEAIDLYQPCRADPDVPYEDTIGAIKDLIDEGKVRYLGVSEVGADLLRRAHAVHPVTALEIEYSLACRFSEAEILPTARELGVGIVAYRVLADGLLSATARKIPEYSGDPKDAPRSQMAAPRLRGDNFDHNMGQVEKLVQIADRKGCAPAQLAIAWLLAQGDDIVPLVGMSRRQRVPENLEILELELTEAERRELDEAFGPDAIKGERYAPAVMPFVAR